METLKNVFSPRITVRARLRVAALGRVSLIGFGALLGAASVQAQNPGNYGSFTTTGGIQVWTGPGPVVTKPPAGVNWSRVFERGAGTVTDVVVKDTGAVALRNGTAVALTANRLVTAANVLAATRALAGGPVGVALLIGIPAFQYWVNQDNTRIASNPQDPGKPFEIKNENCQNGSCYEFTVDGRTWGTDPAALGQAAIVARQAEIPDTIGNIETCYREFVGTLPQTPGVVTCWWLHKGNGVRTYTRYSVTVRSTAAGQEWLPASLSDIEPYLGPRPTPTDYLPSLLDKGASVQSTPNGITGPSTAPAEPPVKKTTQVPTPAPSTTTSQRQGNPDGLPVNTPTVTKETTGSTPTTINGKPVNQPNKTVTESTYDPDTNRTTDSTTTTHTPIRVEETTTSTTNISYTTNTANATTINNTTTNIINNVTNTVINTTTDQVDTKPAEESDPCAKNPDSLMCAKPDLDTPDGEIPKDSKTITYQEENLFGSGSCPANLQTTLGTLHKTVTVWDWQKTCDYALPLRAIVIALASFAAFLIVMPGGSNRV